MKLRNKQTGEIWNLINRNEGTSAVIWVSNGCQTYRIETIKELAEEWEDVEPKEAYYLDFQGGIRCAGIDNNWSLEKKIGNYFETKEEAEKAVEKLMAWKRLKDKGFEFVGWTIDDGLRISICTNTDGNSIYDDDKREMKQDLDLVFGGEE